MTLHLRTISNAVAPDAHAIVVADGAGYHHKAAIRIPDNITLIKLPPYSPELNPIENVWQYLRCGAAWAVWRRTSPWAFASLCT